MNETGREFCSVWHRYCGHVSECPYLLEILHEIFRDTMSWSPITLEWLPKKQINTFYMCRKRWRWQNGHCWSWAVSACVFNVQFFLLSFMFESTYHKKLNKNKNKTPILAHGPWWVVGPVAPEAGKPVALVVAAFLVFTEPGPISTVLVSLLLLCRRPLQRSYGLSREG